MHTHRSIKNSFNIIEYISSLKCMDNNRKDKVLVVLTA